MGERRGAELRWVEDPSALRRRAAALVVGFAGLRENARIRALVEEFHDEQVFRVVFESNHLEGAGPGSLTETRKIAAEALGPRRVGPMGSAQRRFVVRRVWASEPPSWAALAGRLRELPRDVVPPRHLPVVTFQGRSRLGLEVLQHATAVERTLSHAKRFNLKRVMHWLAERNAWAKREGQASFGWPDGWPPEAGLARPRLVDQAFVKRLHETIAHGLLDLADTDGVEPGSYRVDRRGAGPLGRERWFLAPRQIEPAMRAWVRRSNKLALEPGAEPLHRACWIMHRFTEIHPFPDFNGRVARLLLNLSLYADGLPFPVSFPVGAKWRRRYQVALQAGDRGELEPMMTLVARAIVDAFERLDAQLRAAGLTGVPEGKIGSVPPIASAGQWGWGKTREDGPAPGLTPAPRRPPS